MSGVSDRAMLESVRLDRADVRAELSRLHGFLARRGLLATYWAERDDSREARACSSPSPRKEPEP